LAEDLARLGVPVQEQASGAGIGEQEPEAVAFFFWPVLEAAEQRGVAGIPGQ